MMAPHYIGLMSGTSLDGIDAVLALDAPDRFTAIAHRWHALPPALRDALEALNHRDRKDELHAAALAANGLARAYADAVEALLASAGMHANSVRALGAHGQTVRHQPGQYDGTGYTLQLLNGALLAELSGIDVVCDFRSRDVAAGGQGAPLVPAFHAAAFGRSGRSRVVLNLGGIANLSLLSADGSVTGFDCGPGNVLMDGWCRRHLGQAFDADGAWAAGGRVDPSLLARLWAEPFFHQPPPKSTGRDLFHAAWLDLALQTLPKPPIDARAVQATLAELTVRAVVQSVRQYRPDARELMVCGGGAFNGHLMARLKAELPEMQVLSTEAAGLPPMQVEAAAFAWLAREMLARRPGNLGAVTGARGPRVLGALYPAC